MNTQPPSPTDEELAEACRRLLNDSCRALTTDPETVARALLTRLEREADQSNGVLTLTAEEFDELERCMTEPREPTEAMKRAAEMHAKLIVKVRKS